MKNPDRNTKYYFLDLVDKGSSLATELPRLKHFSKVHDEISIGTREFVYCIFHAHEHLEIFYFEKGRGVFETKNGKTEIKANDVIIVNKGAKHRVYSQEEPLEYFNLAVDNFSLEGNEENRVSNQDYEKISLKNKENNIYSIMRKFEIMAKKEHIRPLRAYSVVYEILDLITEILLKRSGKTKTSTPFSLNEKVKNYILENYDKDVTIEELSKRFFISKSHLGHSFKSEYGISPIKFLIGTRVEQAKVLLLCTNKNVTEISSEVGFSNPNYFSYYFSKLTGKSPSEFRKTSSDK